MSSPPTYASAALGYRTWYICDGLLASTGAGRTVWRPGVNLMSCKRHIRPSEDCSCGLYAFHELELAKECNRLLKKEVPLPYYHRLPIVGAVAFRGKVESHHHGLRGEEACILALALISGQPEQQMEAHQIAEHYGVPLVPLEELESFAAQHALAVPKEQRGADPTPPPRIPDGRFPWRPLGIMAISVSLTCLFWSLVFFLFVTKQQTWLDLPRDEQTVFFILISWTVIATALIAADKDLHDFGRGIRTWRSERRD